MNVSQGLKAVQILEECLEELESSKGSVSNAVQKLYRASSFLGEEDISTWCEIQLGEFKYTLPLNRLIDALEKQATGNKSKKTEEVISSTVKELKELGLKPTEHYSTEELNVKLNKGGGGYTNISFVEEKYLDLVRTKSGNDGKYYKTNLSQHLAYVRKATHQKATSLYSKYASLSAPASTFDTLKEAVDDRLLDLSPPIAEQLMVAFRRISSDIPEEWSQALTSCRRLIESLADKLYPPRTESVKGRAVGQNQYINRLWAYMDEVIESDSNKELAKAHVDYLGGYLQRIHKISNKGVHTDLTRVEAIKAVFHLYLTIADILDYLEPTSIDLKPNIHIVSLDKIREYLGVNQNIAKQIVRLRATEGKITEQSLMSIKGVGPKTIDKAKQVFSFAPPLSQQDAG